VRFGRVPKREKAKILAAMQTSRIKSMECRVMGEMADESKMIETIVRAHYDTCDYTADKIQPFLARAHAQQIQTHCTGLVSTYLFLFKIRFKFESSSMLFNAILICFVPFFIFL
jgi:hypothetical protein